MFIPFLLSTLLIVKPVQKLQSPQIVKEAKTVQAQIKEVRGQGTICYHSPSHVCTNTTCQEITTADVERCFTGISTVR